MARLPSVGTRPATGADAGTRSRASKRLDDGMTYDGVSRPYPKLVLDKTAPASGDGSGRHGGSTGICATSSSPRVTPGSHPAGEIAWALEL